MKITLNIDIEATATAYSAVSEGSLFVFGDEYQAYLMAIAVAPSLIPGVQLPDSNVTNTYVCRKLAQGYVRQSDPSTILTVANGEASKKSTRVLKTVFKANYVR